VYGVAAEKLNKKRNKNANRNAVKKFRDLTRVKKSNIISHKSFNRSHQLPACANKQKRFENYGADFEGGKTVSCQASADYPSLFVHTAPCNYYCGYYHFRDVRSCY
jgi:hypothetical protein